MFAPGLYILALLRVFPPRIKWMCNVYWFFFTSNFRISDSISDEPFEHERKLSTLTDWLWRTLTMSADCESSWYIYSTCIAGNLYLMDKSMNLCCGCWDIIGKLLQRQTVRLWLKDCYFSSTSCFPESAGRCLLGFIIHYIGKEPKLFFWLL